MADVQNAVRATLAADGAGDGGDFELVVPAPNRRGRAIRCRVVGTPLRSAADDTPQGVILLMNDATEG